MIQESSAPLKVSQAPGNERFQSAVANAGEAHSWCGVLAVMQMLDSTASVCNSYYAPLEGCNELAVCRDLINWVARRRMPSDDACRLTNKFNYITTATGAAGDDASALQPHAAREQRVAKKLVERCAVNDHDSDPVIPEILEPTARLIKERQTHLRLEAAFEYVRQSKAARQYTMYNKGSAAKAVAQVMRFVEDEATAVREWNSECRDLWWKHKKVRSACRRAQFRAGVWS
eukprot:COSAG01_NODE_8951_length_2605_cov_8.451317_3_plen_230_part_01